MNEKTHRHVENATGRTREAKTGVSDLELSTPTFSQAPPKDKNTTADGVYGSGNFNSPEKFLGKLPKSSSCSTLSLSPLSLLPPTVTVCSLPSSHLPLSPTVPDISEGIVFVCSVPLGSCLSSLSLSLDRRTELVMGSDELKLQEDGLQASSRMELVMGRIQRCTWLLKSGVEGSKSQLAASKGKIGMNLTLVGDKLNPALSVNMIWFRGELITMLCGRFCSLRKEKKKKAGVEWQTKKLSELT